MTNLPETRKKERGIALQFLPAEDLSHRVSGTHEMVARRAYELFTSRGSVHGHDLDDWLEAESEVVHTCRHELRETGQAVIVRAELPGSFRPDQLQLSVEPKRLIVSGEKDLQMICGGHYTAHLEKRTRRILEIQDLPAVVDPTKATATLKGETLEILMPKGSVDGKSKGTVKAASVGR